MSEGIVECVQVLWKGQDEIPCWWMVKLTDVKEAFALHRNWLNLHGDLNPGDKVEYEASKAKIEECLLFNKLRKIEEEKPLEKRRTDKWKKLR